MAGFVSLIGAGPGDPGLLTVRGYKALEDADVIIYDNLVNFEILLPFTYKELHGLDQLLSRDPQRLKNIFRVFSKNTQEGKHVARLKGGDPLVFGRGYEEIKFLRDSQIKYEIIPGITAALGASAYAEIPLTQRGVSSSVAFCTGHSAAVKVPDADTIVYYMGSARLSEILEEVFKKGFSKKSCVTVVQNATKSNQLVITTSLGEALKNPQPVKSPAVAIIRPYNKEKETGGDGSAWFVQNLKILVTGTSAFRYRELGEITHVPLIEVKELKDFDLLDDSLKLIKKYNIIIFTSRYGVRAFFNRLFICGLDARSLLGIKVAVIGKQTANELKKGGIKADIVAKNESSQGLLETLAENFNVGSLNILLLQSQLSDHYLVSSLNKYGAHVTNLVAYSVVKRKHCPALDFRGFYAIIFTSPSTARAFYDIYGTPSQGIKIWCRGIRTQQESLKLFGRGDIIKHHDTYELE